MAGCVVESRRGMAGAKTGMNRIHKTQRPPPTLCQRQPNAERARGIRWRSTGMKPAHGRLGLPAPGCSLRAAGTHAGCFPPRGNAWSIGHGVVTLGAGKEEQEQKKGCSWGRRRGSPPHPRGHLGVICGVTGRSISWHQRRQPAFRARDCCNENRLGTAAIGTGSDCRRTEGRVLRGMGRPALCS